MKQEMYFMDYIERYLDGTMNASEFKWFQKELEGNTQLQEDLRMQQKLKNLIAEQKTISLQAQLDLIHNDLFKRNQPITGNRTYSKKRLIYTVMAVAASCALFFTIIKKQYFDDMNKNDLYTEYFKPADIGMVFRSSGDDLINNDLRSAMVLYEGRKYNEAINIFENILNKDSSRIGLNLYTGISHMEIKEYEEANKNFKKIIDHRANAFIESAEWYLGLCYLMTNKNDKAKDVFIEISESSSYYNKDAKNILKKINK